MKYEHVVVARCLLPLPPSTLFSSSMLAHPFSQGAILDVKVLCVEGTFLAVSASTMEVAITERDNGILPWDMRTRDTDRWHRITSHQVPAHCLAVTPFSDEHRGAFVVAGSSVYCRIKALQYTGGQSPSLQDQQSLQISWDSTTWESRKYATRTANR